MIQIEKDFERINSITEEGLGINRLAYTIQEREAINYVKEECIRANMSVKIDNCGNLIARREGQDDKLGSIATGSHLDTVYEGGKYDGTTGVIAGLQAIRNINEKKIKTKRPIELIVFACEESSRFGVSTLGSKAMVGEVDFSKIKSLKDKDNITIENACKNIGLNIEQTNQCKREKNSIKSFIELHIEQSPYLERDNLDIGIVTGISAPTRLNVKIKGLAEHSGSTRMFERQDALVGASRIVLAVKEFAEKEARNNTVGTVGTINVKPGAMNVIPGYAEVNIDIRGIIKKSIDNVTKNLINYFGKIEKDLELKVSWEILSEEEPILTDKRIQSVLEKKCIDLGLRHTYMNSGAGHDAMNMARMWPTGMIFIPSKKGISHNPNEYTDISYIKKGTILLEKTLVELANL